MVEETVESELQESPHEAVGSERDPRFVTGVSILGDPWFNAKYVQSTVFYS